MTNQMLHSRDDTVSIVTRRMLLSTHPQNSHFLFVYSYPRLRPQTKGIAHRITNLTPVQNKSCTYRCRQNAAFLKET